MSSGTFYEILGVDADASQEDVRRAYKKMALKTHPDRLPQGSTPADKKAADEEFRKVNNAYEILNDPKNRRLYDLYGVWPPPDDLPEQPGRQREEFFGHPRHHRTYLNPFDDPFFRQSPFGGPFSSHRHYSHHSHDPFMFRDPFELFNSIFADMHNFSAFPEPPSFVNRSQMMFDPFGAFPGPTLLGAPPFHSFPDYTGHHHNRHEHRHRGVDNTSGSNGMRSYSFRSSSNARYSSGQSGTPHWVSESTTTRMVNGVTHTVHTKKDSDGNVHVRKIYPDGRERYTLNGIEQPQSSGNRHVQDADTSAGFLPPPDPASSVPDHDMNDTLPIIPPKPEEGSSRRFWWTRR